MKHLIVCALFFAFVAAHCTASPGLYSHRGAWPEYVTRALSAEESRDYTPAPDPPTIDRETQALDWSGTEWIVREKPARQIERETAQAWQRVYERIAAILTETTWTQAPDIGVDQQAWAAYRLAVRNIATEYDDPRKIVWPKPPGEPNLAKHIEAEATAARAAKEAESR